MDFVSLVVLIICVNQCVQVSGQYFQYKSNDGFQPVTDKRIESATQPEYEYYDEIDESSTLPGLPNASIGSTTTTTTTTTTTQKPTTSHRFLTTRRSSFRTNFNKKKFNVNQPYYSDGDSYTEASNENEFVQQQQSSLSKAKQPTPPQLRNSVIESDRRVNGKDDNFAEKKSSSSIDSDKDSYVSRRYARFLFRMRTG